MENRPSRLEEMRALAYDDLAADRNVVAVVQALAAILGSQAAGHPGGEVTVEQAGLVLRFPGRAEAEILYPGRL